MKSNNQSCVLKVLSEWSYDHSQRVLRLESKYFQVESPLRVGDS